jgi:hypothetical protein
MLTERAADEGTADRAAEPLMTLAEAAATTGRPKEALRAMIRRGKLKARKGNDGQFLVELPVELRQPHGQPIRGRTAKSDEAAAGRAAELEEVVEEWRTAAEEARLAAAVATAERDAAKIAATAEAATLRELIAELRSQLAEARRPWWRRWLT